MKVFELMAYLAEMPAGAEVRMRSIMNVSEFAECENADNGDKIIDLGIEEVTEVNGSLVSLYN